MSPETHPLARIERPLRDLSAWLAYFRAAPIPVLDATADAVRELAANEDAVDPHSLAETVAADPLMTLKLLAHVGSNSRRETDVETVVGALVLLGIGPFFRHFGELPTVGQALGDTTDAAQAHAGLRAVLARSHRAAQFALGFAAHRMDPDAVVIDEAALLHGFAELLLWSMRRRWPSRSRGVSGPTPHCVRPPYSRRCSASHWPTCSIR